MLLGIIGVAVFLVSLGVSTAVTVWFLVKLPADYFVADPKRRTSHQPDPARWLRFAGRNLLALALIVLGIVLSLPGIPGQGILTILLGIMISDFPGKQKLERKIAGFPRVLEAINHLRARFAKPPLVL